MKRIFLLLAVVLSVFCFGSAALAEGFTVSGDLTMGTPNAEGNGTDSLGYLTIGGDYDLDPFLIGGSLLVCVYVDPPLDDTQEAMTFLYGAYGGYNIINGDSFKLAGLAGYYFYKQDLDDSDGEGSIPVPFKVAWNASSLMIGVRAAFDADPISVSLIYMYGVSNESTMESAVIGDFDINDPAVSWFELKGSYAFSDAWSVYLAYRGFSVDSIDLVVGPADIGATSIGAGVTYKF